MIIFLFGADSFRSKRLLQDMKTKFIREVDAESNSLDMIDGQAAELKTIEEKINTGSLFARKRMIIIENIFKNKKTTIFPALATKLKKIADDDSLIIIFRDGELDTKDAPLKADAKKLFAVLEKQKYVQEFKLLSAASLLGFIKSEALSYGKNIAPAAANELMRRTGGDSWLIAQAIKKASLGTNEQTLNTELIKEYSNESFAEDIFSLTDAIGTRDKKRALQILEEQYAAGLEDEGIIAMLIRHFKILILISEADKRGIRPEQLAVELKIHPFVAKKGLIQARNFQFEQLITRFNSLIALDFANKTGRSDVKTELSLLLANL